VSDAEVQMAIRLSAVGRPVILLKEAVAYLGQVKDERTERALINRVGEYEAALLKPGSLGTENAELLPVLDRIVFALARLGTPAAIRTVVNHGLKRHPQLGDTAARLAPLAGTDLSETLRLSTALSRRSRPSCRTGYSVFSSRRTGASCSASSRWCRRPQRHNRCETLLRTWFNVSRARSSRRPAAKLLAGAELPPAPPLQEPPQSASLSGDLELFGLPTLLQNLSQSTASGSSPLPTLSERRLRPSSWKTASFVIAAVASSQARSRCSS